MVLLLKSVGLTRQQEGCSHELIEVVTLSQDLHRFKLDKIPAEKRGYRQEVPSITRKLFAINTCWERKYRFSLGKIIVVGSSYTIEL